MKEKANTNKKGATSKYNCSDFQIKEDSNCESQSKYSTVLKSVVDRQRRVLFVMAHPDDECMFFGPTILHFTQKENAMVFLICMTNGSYYSREVGKNRQRELWASCQLLGIPHGNITLYRCESLPDGPDQNWPVVNTAFIINKHLHALQCDMVVSFDRHGVSGHANHRSLHAAILHLSNEHLLPPGCFAYTLDSVNALRKYSSRLDYPASLVLSSHVLTTTPDQAKLIQAAMRAHESQYVWFRKLYMIFSRYVVMNTLTQMVRPDTKAEG